MKISLLKYFPQQAAPWGRELSFLFISLGLHVLGIGTVLLLGHLAWQPRLDVTWLDTQNRMGAPLPMQIAPAAPQAPALPTPPPAPTSKAKPTPAKEKAKTIDEEEAKFAIPVRLDAGASDASASHDASASRDTTSDGNLSSNSDGAATSSYGAKEVALTDLAPGDAAFFLMLRMDRLRETEYAPRIRRLLEVFYDHRTLLWNSDIDPVNDFSTLLIASPNPYYVTQTFLVGIHNLPDVKVRRAIERSTKIKQKKIRWSKISNGMLRGDLPSPPRLEHDPRVVILAPGLVMFTDPNYIPLLSSIISEPSAQPAADAGPASMPVLPLLKRLQQMNERGGAGNQADQTALMIQLVNLPRLIRLPRNVPMPQTVQIAAKALPASGEAIIAFTDEKQAEAFYQVLPTYRDEAKRNFMLRLLGVTNLLDAISFEKEASTIKASLNVSSAQMQSILEIFRNLIPQVHVPGMPDRVTQPRPDAGINSSSKTR